MDTNKWITPFLKQTWSASSVLICTIGQGMSLSYMTCLIPALKEPDSPIKIDLASMSWLSSSYGSCMVLGLLISSLLMNRIGRRKTFMICTLPGIAGWLAIITAQNYSMLLIGRFFHGISAGLTAITAPIVIGEYTAPKYRGVFLNLKAVTFYMGTTLVHILGKYADWRTIAMLAMIPFILVFGMTYTWPESPSWLVSKNLFEKSEIAFFWLRGTDDLSKWEIASMIRAQKDRLAEQKNRKNVYGKILEFFKKFKRRDFVKPVIISGVAYIMSESTTRHVYPVYALQIMAEVAETVTLPYYYTLAMDLIILAGATLSSVLIRFLNRRTLLFSSGISSLVVLGMTCTYLILVSHDVLSKTRPWIGICLLGSYFILINLGSSSFPITLQGEIFPLPHRETGAAIAVLIKSVSMMTFLKGAPYLFDSLKVCGAFLVFGSILAVTLIILYFIVPETKDRTLQEIEDYFNYGKFDNEFIYSDEGTRLNVDDEVKSEEN